MTTYFTSDLHFGHNKILKFCPNTRKGSTVDEMNSELVESINSTVTPQDTLYVLGDTFFCNAGKAIQIMDSIKCKQIHLIYGNHDQTIKGSKPLQAKFASIRDYQEIKIGDDNIVLFHFPLISWNKSHYGAYHLFGHEHGSLIQQNRRCMDVGVDNRNDNTMKPRSWEEIREFLHDYPFTFDLNKNLIFTEKEGRRGE